MEWVFIGFQIGLGILASLAFVVAALAFLNYFFEDSFFMGVLAVVFLVLLGGGLIFPDEIGSLLVYLDISSVDIPEANKTSTEAESIPEYDPVTGLPVTNQ